MRLRHILLPGLAAALLPQVALAQLIDLYLPNDLSRRYAIEALPDAAPLVAEDLPVLQRPALRPELRPLGVRLGSFMLRPEASTGIGYESKPLPGTDAKGAAMVRSSASADVASQWSRHSLGARFGVDDYRYLSTSKGLPDPSRTDWSGTVYGTRDIGRDALSLSASHLSLSETPEAIDASSARAPVRFNVEDLRASYRAVFGRSSVTPEFGFRRYRFDSNDNSQFSGGDQTTRDRDVFEAGATGRYGLVPSRDLVVVLRGGRSVFRRDTPGLDQQDSSTVALLAGIDDSSGGVFRYRLLVGYQIRDYDSGAISTRQAPVLEGGVTWLATRLTTVSGIVSRRIEDSSSEGRVGYTLTLGKLSVDHELQRNILVGANVGIDRADFTRGGGTTTVLSAGATGSYKLNRNTALNLDYRFADRDATRGFSYSGHTALLRLGFAL